MANDIKIRTSDRTVFKRCRRRWDWQSSFRRNLKTDDASDPLWTGTGVHFALEDFHGYNKYKYPARAFKAFVIASLKDPSALKPENLEEQTRLGMGMLYYYHLWLKDRDPLRTFFDEEGRAHVEVSFEIPLEPYGIVGPNEEPVFYKGTLDRVVEDREGNLWIVEYKTAKRFETVHYMTDPQISAYCWAASKMYPQYNVVGVIYMQFRKDLPSLPKVLMSGRISTDKRQPTTYKLYRKALKALYGTDYRSKAPQANLEFLDALLESECVDSDPFIRRDRVYRSPEQIDIEEEKIILEVQDMLDTNLRIYPNPTRACSFECPFFSPCVTMDEGGDWESELNNIATKNDKEFDSWREFLPDPGDPELDSAILGIDEEELKYE